MFLVIFVGVCPVASMKYVIENIHVCTGCQSCAGWGLAEMLRDSLPDKGQSEAPPRVLCRERQKVAARAEGSGTAGGERRRNPVFSIGCVLWTDCKVQPHPCEHKTLETVRELAGNALCWRGSRGTDGVLAALCPFSRFVHKVWGQSRRAWPGWEWRPPQGCVLTCCRENRYRRRSGREPGTEFPGCREGHSYSVSVSLTDTTQAPRVSEGGRVTAILEAGR